LGRPKKTEEELRLRFEKEKDERENQLAIENHLRVQSLMQKQIRGTNKIEQESITINKIFASAKETADRRWSRKIEFVMSDNNVLSFYWDKAGKLYYTTNHIDKMGHMQTYIRNNESYELEYKDGKIIEIKTPEAILENIEEFAGNKVAPTELDLNKVVKPVVCKEHKTYTGKRRPRLDCPVCWALYRKLHPGEK
jgi:hypothetical protein